MTIDKIKHNLPENIFNYWTTLINHYPYSTVKERLNQAKKQLREEIDAEIFGLPVHYVYELKLLEHLTN